jgi:hypothetical protein
MAAHLLIGEAANPEIAGRIAEQYAGCPYVHFISPFGNSVVGIWYLPESQRWWLELVAEQPMLTLGLQRAAVYRTEHPAFPKSFEIRQGFDGSERALCGAMCPECERAGACSHCPGCASYDPEREEGSPAEG